MQWTPEEQAAHRKLWVEALRSGKYEQARADLHIPMHGMCCLGVACEVSGLGGWSGTAYVINGERTAIFLPDEVREWVGLRDEAGRNSAGPALYQLNDTHRKTFAEIADIIESEPEGLIAKPESL